MIFIGSIEHLFVLCLLCNLAEGNILNYQEPEDKNVGYQNEDKASSTRRISITGADIFHIEGRNVLRFNMTNLRSISPAEIVKMELHVEFRRKRGYRKTSMALFLLSPNNKTAKILARGVPVKIGGRLRKFVLNLTNLIEVTNRNSTSQRFSFLSHNIADQAFHLAAMCKRNRLIRSCEEYGFNLATPPKLFIYYTTK
uniref:uncharacterized protein LOC120330253 n=1 Tax=Styela clava TaxID=7725 RepID=UPI001939A553|nr:uncharacterized protein LOC120330253 [Styela clava]